MSFVLLGKIPMGFGGLTLLSGHFGHFASRYRYTVDGSEIPFPTTWDGAKNPENNRIFTISTGETAGFLNHQQYYIIICSNREVPAGK